MTDDDITPAITLGGAEGTMMRYYAFSGPQYSPGEVGWVLVVDGGPDRLDPQALTVADVMGDLEATIPPDDLPAIREILRWRTQDMIGALARDDIAAPRQDGEPSAAERLAGLRAEFAAVFGSEG